MGFLKKLRKLLDAPDAEDSPRKVFAHYMVGLTCEQSLDQWYYDIKTAAEAGIDGFALNIGPSDHWTETQLFQAYHAAEQVGNFVLFISFDMACGEWLVPQVVHIINCFKASPAQMKVDGKPFVSTFEGPHWADNWAAVREETGGIFLIPDWSSLGPYGVGERLDAIDGAFSWDAWPKACHTKMSTNEDELYLEVLKGKKYMMPISPCFYTNLPQWSKNWYCSSESLWYDRWLQALKLMPDYIQIITWNDYGESSYICDTVHSQIVEGAETYAANYSHSAFRAVLPYFIAAFKAGTPDIDPPGGDTAVAWYRTTSAQAGDDGETKWGQGGSESASLGARDVVSVIAVTKHKSSLAVSIGETTRHFETDDQRRISYFEVPFDSSTVGPVRITLNEKASDGPAITNDCDGHVVFNCVAVQV
ncbi:glycoside hydrolase [Echria macrotheca]|uniref:Glycoside hydrolase n=1 Tax=Echria macrotheca TaxID=438768 RepID=A0AAJ0BAJ5_9PEZI|nr:glycoside hydrolase [Echria macrotheca]